MKSLARLEKRLSALEKKRAPASEPVQPFLFDITLKPITAADLNETPEEYRQRKEREKTEASAARAGGQLLFFTELKPPAEE